MYVCIYNSVTHTQINMCVCVRTRSLFNILTKNKNKNRTIMQKFKNVIFCVYEIPS